MAAKTAGAKVTQPQRRFMPSDLSLLPRPEIRKLVHVLLEEAGAAVVDYQRRAGHDDLHAELDLLWARRSICVRVAASEVGAREVARFSEALASSHDVAGWLVAPLGVNGDFSDVPDVNVVGPAELIARLERSTRVVWNERRPAVAMDRLAHQRALFDGARYLDPVGMLWLPGVAHNEMPPGLRDAPGTPQDWLERLVFRLLTHTFRFEGVRYGEAARGRRLPDALLRLPPGDGAAISAMLDCKASADGYTMTADHFLRFKEYVRICRGEAESEGHDLRYMIVVSSTFSGSGRSHPFHARHKALSDESGLSLAYVRAIDLAETAVAVEREELKPSDRDRLPWANLLEAGLVRAEHFRTLLGTVGP